MPGVQVTLFGPVRAFRDGTPVDVGGPRQRAILAVLAVARGQLVPVEQLTAAVWPEGGPADPLASLQSFVSRLRRALQPDSSARARGEVLVSGAAGRSSGYALRLADDGADTWRFEALVTRGSALVDADPARAVADLGAALELWQGPPLADYAEHAWAEAEIARLTELHAVARERRLAARLALGDAAVVVADLEALATEAPLREERWRLLALALYRAHRQADALSALRRARTILAEELGVDPGPALRAVEQEVLAQAPSLDAPPTAAAPRAPRPSDGLFERSRELGVLDHCIEQACAGTGSVSVVEGPAGIGKSRLLAEARRIAGERGVRVLVARASQLEQEFSFGVARQLFEPLVVDPQQRAELLSGAAGAAASMFDDLSATAGGVDDSSFAVLHGLYWLSVNAATRAPLVIAVDDIHWSDTGSLRFLAYLARRVEDLPIALLLAFRLGEQHPLGALIDELRNDVNTVALRPVPLTRAAVAQMIETRLGAPPAAEFVAACFEGTTGNPLLVRQLLRVLEADAVVPDRAHAEQARSLGSRAVSSTVLLRLRRLPASATRVARALAVLGDGAALPHVAELAGVGEDAAVELTGRLVNAEIVRPEPPLAFVHPLVRDAVYSDVPPGERELYHESAAHILDRAGRLDEQVAAQLLHAPRRGDGWVVEVLRRAARDAVRRGSSDGAATFLKRALAEPPVPEVRGSVLLELGIVETSTDGPAAGADLQLAYDTLDDDDARATAAVSLARTLVFVGDFGSPVRFAQRALAELPERLVEPRAAVLAYQRVGGHMHDVDARVWDFDSEPAIPGTGYGSRLLQACVAFERMCRAAPRADAVELAAASLADGQLVKVDPGLSWVWSQVVLDLADDEAVLANWDLINADAHRRGSLFSVLAVGFWRAWSLMRRGDLYEAEQAIRAGLEQLEMWQTDAITMSYGQATLAKILFDQGRTDEAWAAAGDLTREPTPIDGDRLLWAVRAEMLLAEGRAPEALRLLDAVVDRVPEVVNPAWRRDRLLRCLALHRCGARDEAVATAGPLVDLARGWGAGGAVGEALLVLGLAHGSDSTAGMDLLAEAAATLAASPRRVLHADALLALGAARAAHGGSADAVAALHESYRIAAGAGAARVTRRAARVLRRHGLPAVVDEGTAGGAHTRLTATERTVLQLIEAGASVAEVGQKLFLTPSSVERHLESARRRRG